MMTITIEISSTSLNSAIGQDIILREKDTTRLLFRPELVNNIHNSEAAVKGKFIYQRKRKGEEWKDCNNLSLSNIKAGEAFNFTIKSEELFELKNELNYYYAIHRKYGIANGTINYSKMSLENEATAATKLLSKNPDLIESMLDEDKGEVITKAIKWLTQRENPQEIITKLQEFEEAELDKLHTLINITNIHKLLKEWEQNRENQSEKFWQSLFLKNKWILSQIFPTPELFFHDESYIGGKGLSNRGGKIIDFLYQHSYTKDITLIEIKTPNTPLLTNEYRNNVYAIHPELSGAISQVLSYKHQAEKDQKGIKEESEEELNFFNPQCVVVAGNLSSLDNQHKLQSFELFRRELKDITVITFDELYKKIELLMTLLDGND